MQYNEEGYLKIKAQTASGALPLPDISVRITSVDEGNLGVTYSLITDRDGEIRTLALPTPPKVFSESPGAPETVFSKYSVEAIGEGVYKKQIIDIEVFSGITTLLTLDMIPLGNYTTGVFTPEGSTITVIPENEAL